MPPTALPGLASVANVPVRTEIPEATPLRAPVSRDTGMAGMDHSTMTANRGPANDADHEFLRMMSDHHQGVVEMASAAMNKGSTPQVQGDAPQD